MAKKPIGGPHAKDKHGVNVVIGKRSFPNWTAAAKFLAAQPGFVKANLGYIHQAYPGLLKKAGYNVRRIAKTRWTIKSPHGTWHVRSNGGTKLPWSWKGKTDNPTLTKKPTWSNVPSNDPKKVQKGRKQGYGNDPTRNVPADAQGGGVDPVMAALAGVTGFDMSMLQGLRTPNGVPLPLALAAKGAQPMSKQELDALVSTIVQGSQTKSLIEKDISEEKLQSQHNVAQIGRWYDQVLASQATAADRDKQFGEAAVQSATDVTRAIASSIGGEASEGAGMVGAAGNLNVGNLQAQATIQDQYNQDIRPILQAEAAGAKTREQGASAARMRALSRQLIESQQQASADEANLRYQVWQQNNAILNNRIDRELGIRQYNAGLPQQRFANDLSKLQLIMAGQAQQFGQAVTTAQTGQSIENSRTDNAVKIARENREAIKAQQGGWKPYATASAALKKSLRDELGALLSTPEGSKREGMTRTQALKIAANTVNQGYGWNIKNKAILQMVMSIINDLGYEDPKKK